MTDSQQRRTSALLALRDGELGAAERARLLADPAARKELDAHERLRSELRSLPDPEPDAALLGRIQARAAGQSASAPGRWLRLARGPYGLAAGLLIALTAGLVTIGVDQRGGAAPGGGLAGASDTGNTDRVLAVLHERSRQLEPLTIRAGSLAGDPAASALKVRIADVDGQLAAALDGELSQAEAQRLWGQRVALLESLAEVRRARAALQPAVF